MTPWCKFCGNKILPKVTSGCYFFDSLCATVIREEPFENIKISDELPRGADIGVLAGNCDVGPFGKTGDIGRYSGKCSSLTAAERCLAYVKQHIDVNGRVFPAEDQAKASFCSQKIFGQIVRQ